MKSYNLCLEPYCDGCPEFNVKVVESHSEEGLERTITCSHAQRCGKMELYFKKMLKESNNGKQSKN